MSISVRQRYFTIITLALLLSACTSQGSPEAEQVLEREVALQSTLQVLEQSLDSPQAVTATLPFEGFWVSESEDPAKAAQIIVITEDHFYRLQTYDPLAPNLPASASEMFAEIISVDPEMGHMVLRIQWLRTDGQFGGFNFPTVTVTYAVEGDMLRIATMQIDDTQFPDEPDPELYFRR